MRNFIFSFLFIPLFFGIVSAEGAETEMERVVVLPKPRTEGEMSLEEAILKRRSIRSFSQKELSIEQISQILWAAQGITEKTRGFRAAPSAGATFPLEIYLVKKDGIFYYNIREHILNRTKSDDVRSELTDAAWGQSFIQQAPLSIIICVVRSRTTSRYGARGNRYVDIEVGHAAQNLHLQAVVLGLVSVPVGAFGDGEVKKILNLPRDTEPVYIIPVGYAR